MSRPLRCITSSERCSWWLPFSRFLLVCLLCLSASARNISQPSQPESSSDSQQKGRITVTGFGLNGILVMCGSSLTISFVANPIPTKNILIPVNMPPGFVMSVVSPSGSSEVGSMTSNSSSSTASPAASSSSSSLTSTSILIPAAQGTPLQVKVTATASQPTNSERLLLGNTISDDVWFNGIQLEPNLISVACTLPGSVTVGVDNNGLLESPGEFRIFTDLNLMPNRAEVYVQLTKQSSESVAGGFLPISLPPGVLLESPRSQPPGLKFPKDIADLWRKKLTFISNGTATIKPVTITFGSIVSEDLQWAGVKPNIDSITISTVDLGTIAVSPSTVGMFVSSSSVVYLTPSIPPAAPVTIALFPPVGYNVSESVIILPQGSTTPYPLTFFSPPQPAKPFFARLFSAVSSDVAFNGVVPGTGAVEVYTTTAGKVNVLGLPQDLSLAIFTGTTVSITVELVSTGGFSIAGGKIRFSVPWGFTLSPSSLEFPKFPESEAAVVRQQFVINITADSRPRPFRSVLLSAVESSDFQWNSVQPNVSEFKISSVSVGVIGVSTTRLSTLARGKVSFFLFLSVPPTDTVTLSITAPASYVVTSGATANIPAGTTRYEVQLESFGEADPRNITISDATSKDIQFNGMRPNVTQVEIYSTIQGVVDIVDHTGARISPPYKLQLRTNSQFPIFVSLRKLGRHSVDGGLLPIKVGSSEISVVGQGVTAEGFSFPAMESRERLIQYEIAVRASAKPAGPVNLTFHSLVSNDVQWNGVKPSVSTIEIQSVLTGEVLVSVNALDLPTNGEGSLVISLSTRPFYLVTVEVVAPPGFSIQSAENIAPSASTTGAVTVSFQPFQSKAAVLKLKADAQPRLPAPLRILPAKSADVTFDSVKAGYELVMMSSAVKGTIQVEDLSPAPRENSTTSRIFTTEKITFLLKVKSGNFFSSAEAIIPINVPSGFVVEPSSILIPNWGMGSPTEPERTWEFNVVVTATDKPSSGLVQVGPAVSEDVQWSSLVPTELSSFAISSTKPGSITISPSTLAVFASRSTPLVVELSNSSDTTVALQFGEVPQGMSFSSPHLSASNLLTIPPETKKVSIAVSAGNVATWPKSISVSAAVSDDLQFAMVKPNVQTLRAYVTEPGTITVAGLPATVLVSASDTVDIKLEIVKKGKYSVPNSGNYIPISVPPGYKLVDLETLGTASNSRTSPTVYKRPFGIDGGNVYITLAVDSAALARLGPPASGSLIFGPVVSSDNQWAQVVVQPSQSVEVAFSATGQVTVFPTALQVSPGNTGQFFLSASPPPAADVLIPVYSTDGIVGIPAVLKIPAGSTDRVKVSFALTADFGEEPQKVQFGEIQTPDESFKNQRPLPAISVSPFKTTAVPSTVPTAAPSAGEPAPASGAPTPAVTANVSSASPSQQPTTTASTQSSLVLSTTELTLDSAVGSTGSFTVTPSKVPSEDFIFFAAVVGGFTLEERAGVAPGNAPGTFRLSIYEQAFFLTIVVKKAVASALSGNITFFYAEEEAAGAAIPRAEGAPLPVDSQPPGSREFLLPAGVTLSSVREQEDEASSSTASAGAPPSSIAGSSTGSSTGSSAIGDITESSSGSFGFSSSSSTGSVDSMGPSVAPSAAPTTAEPSAAPTTAAPTREPTYEDKDEGALRINFRLRTSSAVPSSDETVTSELAQLMGVSTTRIQHLEITPNSPSGYMPITFDLLPGLRPPPSVAFLRLKSQIWDESSNVYSASGTVLYDADPSYPPTAVQLRKCLRTPSKTWCTPEEEMIATAPTSKPLLEDNNFFIIVGSSAGGLFIIVCVCTRCCCKKKLFCWDETMKQGQTHSSGNKPPPGHGDAPPTGTGSNGLGGGSDFKPPPPGVSPPTADLANNPSTTNASTSGSAESHPNHNNLQSNNLERPQNNGRVDSTTALTTNVVKDSNKDAGGTGETDLAKLDRAARKAARDGKAKEDETSEERRQRRKEKKAAKKAAKKSAKNSAVVDEGKYNSKKGKDKKGNAIVEPNNEERVTFHTPADLQQDDRAHYEDENYGEEWGEDDGEWEEEDDYWEGDGEGGEGDEGEEGYYDENGDWHYYEGDEWEEGEDYE